MHIMDSRDKVLLSKTMRLVKVLSQHRGVNETTWERKDIMHPTIPSCSRQKVCFSH